MSTEVTLIAAMGLNRVIGLGDELPWTLPADLRHFRRKTIGKPILMGRRTFESIGKPLPKRRNIVLSRQSDYHPSGVDSFQSLDDALNVLADEPELMVIGGSYVYEHALPRAHRMLLTVIHESFEGDVLFPLFPTADWFITSREDYHPDEKNRWAYSFLELKRIPPGVPLPPNFPLGL